MKTKRCFVAVDFPRSVINEVGRIQNLIRRNKLFLGKFTDPENLHLTLKFLGEIDENKLGEVKERLKEIKLKGFEMKMVGIGVFSKRVVRIVWIKLKNADELQKQIDESLEGLFEKENRFMGHVTIARVKHVYNKKKFLDYLKSITVKKIEFKVDNFYLMESELSFEGPVYKEIKKYSLGS